VGDCSPTPHPQDRRPWMGRFCFARRSTASWV